MLVPRRHGAASNYRYGFQGQEKDDELKGEGNSYDYGARMYDSRVGRWFARDPKENNYPNLSPYNAFDNNPIVFKDPDGKDAVITISGNNINVKAVIYIDNSGKNKIDVAKAQMDIMKVYGGNHKSGKYNVKFDIVVMEKPPVSFPAEIPKFGEGLAENFVQPKEQGFRSEVINYKYGNWMVGENDNTYSHEVGHMLELADRYKDGVKDPQKLSDDGLLNRPLTKNEMEQYLKNATVISTPVVGSEGDLMANSKNGKISQMSVDAIVDFALKTQKNGTSLINSSTLKDNGNKKGLAKPTGTEWVDTENKMEENGLIEVKTK